MDLAPPTTALNRTYEGLKLIVVPVQPEPDNPLNRTYEGLKLRLVPQI